MSAFDDYADEYATVPQTIPARDIVPGDYIQGLDMACVDDVVIEEDARISFVDGHDREGHMTLSPNMLVTIERRVR